MYFDTFYQVSSLSYFSISDLLLLCFVFWHFSEKCYNLDIYLYWNLNVYRIQYLLFPASIPAGFSEGGFCIPWSTLVLNSLPPATDVRSLGYSWNPWLRIILKFMCGATRLVSTWTTFPNMVWLPKVFWSWTNRKRLQIWASLQSERSSGNWQIRSLRLSP